MSPKDHSQAQHDRPESPRRGSPRCLSLTEQELFERLGWFINVRWAAGIAVLLFVFLGREVFGVSLPEWPVLATVFVMFLYNALFLLLVRTTYRRGQANRPFILFCANSQLVCDLLALTVLMHFTGGIENYFIVAYVFPLVVASELLPRVNAYAQAVLASLLLNGLVWSEYFGFLEHVHLKEVVGPSLYHRPLFVLEASLALTFAIFVSVFLGSTIASRLRLREQQLEEAFTRLGRADEAKSHFMRRVSHELQAPLNTVVNCMRLVLQGVVGQVDDRTYRLFQRAEQRSLALIDLVRDLRRYAALQEATGLIRREAVDLGKIVRDTVDLFAQAAEDKKVRLEVDIPASLPTVVADGEAITEVVSNLVSNAIRYTPEGGTVRVSLQPEDGRVHLVVSDTGIGIPAESLPRIFDEFYRAPNAVEAEPRGTGMGMAIVRRIVELHGGTIHLESTVGKGTTVRVTIPTATDLD